jgi:hypothetical protein
MPEFEDCASSSLTWQRVGLEAEQMTPDRLRTVMAALRQLATHTELNTVDAAMARQYADKRLLTSRERQRSAAASFSITRPSWPANSSSSLR